MENFADQKYLEPGAKGNIPAFLTKLWKIVEDEKYDDLISWNEDGTTIKIHDQVNFSQEILPKFYKHNNFSSFVRQVNMYGFRKIIDVTGTKHGDGDWEFYHTYFQRDHPENIIMVKRKGQLKEDMKMNTSQITNLLQDVEKLKSQHDIVDEKLNLVKVENERLWREVFDLRERHQNQQAMIVKLIQFFLQLVMNKSDGSRKRRYPVEEDIPENVYYQKRSLHLPDTKSKKMAIQCYDPPSVSLAEVLASDPSIMTAQTPVIITHDKESPLTPSTVEVIGECPVVTTGRSKDILLEDSYNIGKSKDVQLNNSSNLQGATKTSQHKATSATSPFIFPEVYKEEPAIIDLSSCISTDESANPILYSVKTGTPDITTVFKKLQGTPQPLSTPVVNMPTSLMRQTSFKDREEVSANVDKISKSIETLQDMLNKQEINLDLKNINLNTMYGEVSNSTSIHDLLKLVYQQPDENSSTHDNPALFMSTEEPESKVVPYTAFSPSHLIDPEYGNVNVVDEDSNTDFFNTVLRGEEEEEEDDIMITAK